ncbi:Hypothetical predicted protein [Olea europaea subsp. europaea]|uniref:Uncharacterized protein n=1 Tax=Olea europaea subsp. europaea TaxID=158383 RepID=A0A8S0T5G8_OLEEU|nr:Hypothetical predicted protein [Olea europaea subsp. europaea]
MVCRARPGRVLAMVGTQLDFRAFVGSLWARCTCHVRDASWARQGHSLIFRHFLAISRTQCVGHVQDASRPWQGRSLIFRQLLEHDVQAVSGTRLGRCISRKFLDTVCKSCPRRVLATVVAGMPPNFQAFLCNFWDSVCRPCLGRVMAKAMFGTRLVRDRDAAWFSGSFWDTTCMPCPGYCREIS